MSNAWRWGHEQRMEVGSGPCAMAHDHSDTTGMIQLSSLWWGQDHEQRMAKLSGGAGSPAGIPPLQGTLRIALGVGLVPQVCVGLGLIRRVRV